MTPLGLRLRNPFNLRPGKTPWLGQIRIAPGNYCEFDTEFHGLRAGFKQLLAYQFLHDCRSIRTIVTRWAPSIENNTKAYIDDVAQRLKIGADDVMDLRDEHQLIELGRAMIRHEQGQQPFSDVRLREAADAALGIQS